MEAAKNKINENILNLTLEIIYLLTGEDYTIVKKTCEKYVIPRSHSSGAWSKTQSPIMEPSPHLLTNERNNEQKMLELTYKIIELLTGEVPMRYQDVTVYFSMEEWEYLEEHKEMYKDMMESHQTLTSSVGFENKNQDEALDTSMLSMCHLKHEDRERNGNVQGIAEESNSCHMEEVAVTTMTHYSSNNTEEKLTSHRGNLIKYNIHNPANLTVCGSPHFLKEPCSSNEANIPNPNTYTFTQYPSTHIKEKIVSSDGENLTDSNTYKPIDNTQHPTIHIKEEQALCDEVRIAINSYASTDHDQYRCSHIKKEPVSSDDGTLIDLNVYTPTDYTQYNSSHIKKEPVSHGGNFIDPSSYTLIDHTRQYPTTHIKKKQAPCDEDCRDTTSFTPTDHTQHLFSHIKKEPVSSNKVCHTDLDIHATICSTQQSTGVQNKPHSYVGGKFTNPNCIISTDCRQQYPFKKKPVLEKASLFQKYDSSLPADLADKDVSGNKNTEQNFNNITISKQYFCTIQQKTHSLEILYNCPECPECFTSNLDLAKHQIIHTGKMPFICSICGRCFGRKTDLIIHLVTHGRSDDFRCPHCDLSFPTKSSLFTHEKTHRQKKLMPCPECGKTFPTTKRLTRHRQIHSDKRPFKCANCGDTFKRKAHLQRHQMIHEKARQQLTCNENGDLRRSEVESSAPETAHDRRKSLNF